MKLVIATLVTLVACTSCASKQADLPYFRTAEMTPEWLTDAEVNAPDMHHVASFTAIDQNGRPVTEKALTGKVTIAHFFFTKCGDICPLTTTHLNRLLDSLPNETRLQVLSYSVRADSDGVHDLQEFARTREVSDSRWHLLTGDRTQLDSLARSSFFVRLGDGKTYGVQSIAHTESIVLVDSQGRLRGVYAGTLPLEMDRLRSDAAQLLATLDARGNQN